MRRIEGREREKKRKEKKRKERWFKRIEIDYCLTSGSVNRQVIIYTVGV
jgi:hypothetical protein